MIVIRACVIAMVTREKQQETKTETQKHVNLNTKPKTPPSALT